MASNDVDDYYYSVGGGVHFNETSQDAAIRETYEEVGIYYEIDRLLFIHENFFDGSGSLAGKRCHEISFHYLMKPQGIKETNGNGICAEGNEYMNWIPISKLKEVNAHPAFYANKLLNLNEEVEHIITFENS